MTQGLQILDILLMNEHGLKLSPWMRWFHKGQVAGEKRDIRRR